MYAKATQSEVSKTYERGSTEVTVNVGAVAEDVAKETFSLTNST